MKIVYLTSGPRGSGKTAFVDHVITRHPEAHIVSRDDILVELFGKTSLCTYSGGHHIAIQTMTERLETLLGVEKDVKILLDCWNGFSRERRRLIKVLRDLGADRVYCWHFTLPLETCIRWFMSKKDSNGYSESGIKWDYNLFYNESSSIETDGFDVVIRIDPRQLLLPSIPII